MRTSRTCLMIFFLSIIFNPPSWAQAQSPVPSIQLEMTSSSMGDGSRIFDCLTYQKCDVVQPRLDIDENANATFVFSLTRSKAEILSELNRCDLSMFKGKLFWLDGKIKTAFKLNPLGEAISLFPALYGKNDASVVQAEFPKIDELIREGNTNEAVQSMISALKIDSTGYSIEYANEAIRDAHTGVDTVTLPAQFKDSCEIIQFLRHEFEHVQQSRYWDQCHAVDKKAVTSYEIIKQMEFAAHMADIAAAEVFCPANVMRITSVNHIYAMDYFDESL